MVFLAPSVFIVVAVDHVDDKGVTHYRVAVVKKPGVGEIQPRLCIPPVFAGDIHFRDWLLAKCINAERAAMQAKTFVRKLYRTRSAYIKNMTRKAAYIVGRNSEGSFISEYIGGSPTWPVKPASMIELLMNNPDGSTSVRSVACSSAATS